MSYGPADDRLHEFYIPCLSSSARYDRSAGFFSVSALAVASQGLAHLITSGGAMRLLVGAQLSRADVNAVADGADLAERIAPHMAGALEEVADAIARERLAALAWMVREGTLDIQVVLPMGTDGLPLPGDEAVEYFHAKEGVFADEVGDEVAFSGSVNESETGWRRNYEQFSVYTSWGPGRPWLEQVKQRFDRLWRGREPDWKAVPVPEAVRERLIRYAPSRAPVRDPDEREEPRPEASDERQRIVFQFLRDAPRLRNASSLGIATSTVDPWPHQRKTVNDIVACFPERFLLADEVGLGKTIEAGLTLRQLVLEGEAPRCLLLVPKSVVRQWQEELYEKLALNVPAYDGGIFTDYFGRQTSPASNPWEAYPIVLASSQLAKRRDRQAEVLAAGPFDLVIIDEAHHARRRDFREERFRPNRLLELLQGLSDRTRGLLLLTATPMQVHAVEVWDLLRLVGLGGRWGANEQVFLRFFRELRKNFDDVDWTFVLRLVREELELGGPLDELFAEQMEDRLGLVESRRIEELAYSDDVQNRIEQLTPLGREVLRELAKQHTPIRRLVFRSTRRLLRRYRDMGVLRESVPERDPVPVWVPMRDDERRLYDRIEEYISRFYARYESERRGLGFVMTVYRRRLTSSFTAIERSLERRLAYLDGKAGASAFGLTDEDREEQELDFDVDEDLESIDRRAFEEEIRYIEDFLYELRALAGDSKWERFQAELASLLSRRDSAIVFTQYTDTMDDLREKLASVYGSEVACYSGRGGEVYRGGSWEPTTKENVKNAFRERDVRILLCTEAASEGLNLQTCGVLVNYDMPWNPMRVEQRIGRIDRIGQIYDVVWIRNFFYEETVEADVYQRLADRIDWFQEVVGELQPILARVSRTIERAALATGEQRAQMLEQELEELRRDLDERRTETLALEEYQPFHPLQLSAVRPPVTLAELERTLLSHPVLGKALSAHPDIAGAYLLRRHGTQDAVTFDANLFDSHPGTLRLLTFGDDILEGLLAGVEPPTSSETGPVLRIEAGSHVAWFRGSERGAEEILSVDDLTSGLDERVLTGEEVDTAQAVLTARARDGLREERDAERKRREAEVAALEETARLLLLKATYADLARTRAATLFDEEEPAPMDFSEDAVRRTATTYPFSALSALAGLDGVSPSPDDPDYVRLETANEAEISRFRSSVVAQARDLVPQLKGMLDTVSEVEPEGDVASIPVRAATFVTSTGFTS